MGYTNSRRTMKCQDPHTKKLKYGSYAKFDENEDKFGKGRWRTRTYQGRSTSQRGSWVINSTLSEKNCVEELFYGFQRNAFPRKVFSM